MRGALHTDVNPRAAVPSTEPLHLFVGVDNTTSLLAQRFRHGAKNCDFVCCFLLDKLRFPSLESFASSYTFKESSSSSSFETGSVAGVHISAPVGQCQLLLHAERVLITLRAFVRLEFSVFKGGAPRCRHEHVHTCSDARFHLVNSPDTLSILHPSITSHEEMAAGSAHPLTR